MLLIFDLDGTLYNTESSIICAVNLLFDELGLARPDVSDILANIGKTTVMFFKSLLPAQIAPEAAADRFRILEREAVKKSGRLYPGVQELLKKLKSDGCSLCVVSNGSLEYIELVLKSTGISGFFTRTYSAKYHDSKATLIKELVTPDDRAVIIGDTTADIDAAIKNNLPSIAALYGYGDKKNLREATFTAQSAEEIDSCVRRLEVYSKITEKLVLNGKRIIGINGIDTSGKTGFTAAYARCLNHLGYHCAVIHMDDFHNPLEIRRSGKNEIDAYYDHAFNYEQLIRKVLEPLKQHGHIDKDVLCLNIDTDSYENTVHYKIDSDTIVLLEGVLLFRPPVSDYLDGRIFLHIDFDEMMRRAAVRDVPRYGEEFLQKYITKYIPIQKRYLEEFRPHINCDIVVDNNDYLYPKIK